MSKILSVTLGWDRLSAVFFGLAATGLYSTLAGLRGVVVIDFIQFGLAMTGSVALAWFALAHPDVGGLDGLLTQLPPPTFELVPRLEAGASASATLALPMAAFVAYLGVQWWASWYSGQEPGGGGYVAQRMLSSRDERHSLLAMLWFTVAHYCIRPWPWVLVALASLVLYPGVADAESGIRTGYACPPPGGLARAVGRCVLRRLYVDGLHAVELGFVVSRERCLRTVRPSSGFQHGTGACLPDRDPCGDGPQRRRDVLLGERSPGLGVRA